MRRAACRNDISAELFHASVSHGKICPPVFEEFDTQISALLEGGRDQDHGILGVAHKYCTLQYFYTGCDLLEKGAANSSLVGVKHDGQWCSLVYGAMIR